MKTTTQTRPSGRSAQTTMKAVRIHEYGGPEVLKHEDVAKPKPAAGEVLVRIHAAGVNPVDYKIRAGARKERLPFTLPIIIGYDLSGVVESVGEDVKDLKEGSEVFGRMDFLRIGSYAEYATPNESEVVLKPASLDHFHAAAMPVAALTAWQALFDQAKLVAGQTVLIHGAGGGVGHFAVQFAKAKGLIVIATASGDNVPFAKQLGADEVVDYKAVKFEGHARGVDAVLDTVGGETQERSWKVVKPGGILVSIVGIEDQSAAERHGVRGAAFMAHPDAEQLAEIAALVDEGRVEPVIETVLPLAEAAQAHRMLEKGGHRGKIVLKVRD
jgi:NADPH:quinone reductase-like Zn-dependent oxidoreductase